MNNADFKKLQEEVNLVRGDQRHEMYLEKDLLTAIIIQNERIINLLEKLNGRV